MILEPDHSNVVVRLGGNEPSAAQDSPRDDQATAPASLFLNLNGVTESSDRNLFSAVPFGLLLVLLIGVTFPDVASGRHSFFYRDFGLFGYPLAHYHRALFWRGELPFWNPFNDGGVPFLAQWNTLTLYPGSLIYLLLPLPWSLSLFSLAHLWLAGMGMYLLARHWTRDFFAGAIAGVVYALNGLMLHAVMWPNNIAALAWLPIVVMLAERGWREGRGHLAKACIAGAIQMLTGAPEIILLTWFIIGAVFIADACRKPATPIRMLFRLALIGLFVAGLSSVQLLPFLELLKHSHRGQGFGGTAWSMPAWGWANFVVPLYHCSKSVLGVYSQDSQQWTSSYYAGAATVALLVPALVCQRQRRFWLLAALAILGLFMALGENGFIYPALKRWVPQLGFARYPIKFVVLTVFALPLLGAFGVEAVRKLQASEAAPGAPALLLAVGCVGVSCLIAGILWSAFRHPALGEQVRVTVGNGLIRALFLVLALAAILAAGLANRRRVIALLELCALVILGLDFMTHAPRQNPSVPIHALQANAVDLSFMPHLGEGRAMITPRVQSFLGYAANPDRLAYHRGHQQALLGNLNLVQEVQKVNGFFSLYLSDSAKIEALLYGTDGGQAPDGLLDFLGVAQISSDTDWFEWTKRASAMPLVTAGQAPRFASSEETLRALRDPGFSPQDIVYLPEEAKDSVAIRKRTRVQVKRTDFRPHQVDVRVEATGASLMIVAQNFYDCWRAFVDDHPVRLWRANAAFQAVEVPSGAHNVRLEYSDPAFELGLKISGAALIAWLGMAQSFRTPARKRMEPGYV